MAKPFDLHPLPTLGDEVSAFTKAIHALEVLIGYPLIPVNRVVDASLPPVYARNCFNSGVQGRPVLPNFARVIQVLNHYFLAQKVQIGRMPLLKYSLKIDSDFKGIVLPYDVILTDFARADAWKKRKNKAD